MLIKFELNESGFRCVDAPVIASAPSINYLLADFEISGPDWEGVTAITAIFKSATYNVVSEIMLSADRRCFIDPEIYKRGGNIQVKLVGDRYLDGQVVSSTHVSEVAEFYVNENLITPTRVPSKYEVFVAEIALAEQAVDDAIRQLHEKTENGYFDGADGADGVGIEHITYNSDGTVNITLTDSSTFTSEYSMKGERGDDGVGISQVDYGQDGSLVITFTDGTQAISAYSMKGEKGDKGDRGDVGASGRGIESIEKTSTSGLVDTYTITYTDGTTSTYTITNGDAANVTTDTEPTEGSDHFLTSGAVYEALKTAGATPNWGASPVESGFILNRPFYSNIEYGNVVVDHRELLVVSDVDYMANEHISYGNREYRLVGRLGRGLHKNVPVLLKPDKFYKLTIEGEGEYAGCVPFNSSNGFSSIAGGGMVRYMSSGMLCGPLLFCEYEITYYDTGVYGGSTERFAIVLQDTTYKPDEALTIILEESTYEAVHKIDPKYLDLTEALSHVAPSPLEDSLVPTLSWDDFVNSVLSGHNYLVSVDTLNEAYSKFTIGALISYTLRYYRLVNQYDSSMHLQTDAKTVIGALNELKRDVDTNSSAVTRLGNVDTSLTRRIANLEDLANHRFIPVEEQHWNEIVNLRSKVNTLTTAYNNQKTVNQAYSTRISSLEQLVQQLEDRIARLEMGDEPVVGDLTGGVTDCVFELTGENVSVTDGELVINSDAITVSDTVLIINTSAGGGSIDVSEGVFSATGAVTDGVLIINDPSITVVDGVLSTGSSVSPASVDNGLLASSGSVSNGELNVPGSVLNGTLEIG